MGNVLKIGGILSLAIVILAILKMNLDTNSAHVNQNRSQLSNQQQSYKTVTSSALRQQANVMSLDAQGNDFIDITDHYSQQPKNIASGNKSMPIHSQLFYKDLLWKWEDALNVIYFTNQQELADPIKRLQNVKSILEDKITTTDCEKALKEDLLITFNSTIDLYIQYSKGAIEKPETSVGENAVQLERAKSMIIEC